MTEPSQSRHAAAILAELRSQSPQGTDHLQAVGRCSLGEAVEELLRLERAGLVRRLDRSGVSGMRWTAVE